MRNDSEALDRRTLLRLASGTALAMGASRALAAPPAPIDVAQIWPGRELVRLWPGAAPGTPARLPPFRIEDRGTPTFLNRVVTGIRDPAMIVCRPARPNGTAILLMPGGGYGVEYVDNDGLREADYWTARGITAFILVYRLPGEGWVRHSDVPLQDAQRALRLIRAHADDYRIASDRIMLLGSSAGGHLAGSLATRFGEDVYSPVDAADRRSARPDLAALLYPVISMQADITHPGSRAALIGADARPSLADRYSVDRRIAADTPPMFLVAAGDDDIVPVENSILAYRAMLARGRSVSMHLFETGGHGFGPNLPAASPASRWPDLLLAFAAARGLLE
ncbi:alpha/beta hydrolase [Sphingopyxis sp. 22461]|uniref:alpha/beta hydrolase n=1 Tax=Sphingopyxis sp. 22461 TaxID=3453923 RepID=UPI003F860069